MGSGFHDDTRAAALFEAILAAPDDDAPRLVLADYLAGKGDPRGELIHLQIMGGGSGDPTPVEYEFAERCSHCVVRRGFVDAITFDGAQYRISDLQHLLDNREIETVTRLEFLEVELGAAGGAVLGAAMHGPLGRLRALTLIGTRLADPGVSLLLAKPAPLRRLTLATNVLGDHAAYVIAEHAPGTLLELDLSNNHFDVGVGELARGRRLDRLEKLWFKQSLTPLGVQSLFAGQRLPSLRTLDISWCGIRDYAGILTHGPFEKLHELDLSGNDIGDRGLMDLVRGHQMQNLRRLQLGSNAITDDGIEFFCRYAHVPNLRRLRLENNQISDAGMARLRAAFPTAESVR